MNINSVLHELETARIFMVIVFIKEHIVSEILFYSAQEMLLMCIIVWFGSEHGFSKSDTVLVSHYPLPTLLPHVSEELMNVFEEKHQKNQNFHQCWHQKCVNTNHFRKTAIASLNQLILLEWWNIHITNSSMHTVYIHVLTHERNGITQRTLSTPVWFYKSMLLANRQHTLNAYNIQQWFTWLLATASSKTWQTTAFLITVRTLNHLAIQMLLYGL